MIPEGKDVTHAVYLVLFYSISILPVMVPVLGPAALACFGNGTRPSVVRCCYNKRSSSVVVVVVGWGEGMVNG